MSKLSGLPLSAHIDSLLSLTEYNTIYGFPTQKIYRGFKGYDFSVNLFGKLAATPMGPAAGPHTQLAQNIILSYLAGSRIIELKTIQILDQLEISRPCIDMRNIGFNVEWSQELSLDESFQEYMNAWILLHMVKERNLLAKKTEYPFYDFIFDVSVGYDLKGIQSEQVQSWLKKIKNAETHISKAINSLPEKYSFLSLKSISPNISDSATLSTFHGCPPDEIEAIAKYLIKENGFNVVIKLNPTLLGYNYVHDLLINKLGYKTIELDKTAFNNDLTIDSAIEMISRLKKYAKDYGHSIGIKFTNTLVVKNNENIFNESVRYLSGAPLYVIAVHTMHQFREKIGWDLPVSFSGGVNQSNFADTLACHIVPVTACTDILKKGGYTRFVKYLVALKSAMDYVKSSNINSFILNRAEINKKEPIWKAGQINTENTIKQIDRDSQYLWYANSSQPKSIPSKLTLFDCINCNICIPVCPNAANFSFKTDKQMEQFSDYKYVNGSFFPINQRNFAFEKDQQIGNIAEFCNDCGNCETFCPEIGAPFKEKPRLYINKEYFKTSGKHSGFYFASPDQLYMNSDGNEIRLVYDSEKRIYNWDIGHLVFRFDERNKLLSYDAKNEIKEGCEIDLTEFIKAKLILNSIITHRKSFPLYLT